MSQATLRVKESPDPLEHSRLELTLRLDRPLRGYELVDLAQAVKAWTRRELRVVCCAGGGSAWWSEWSDALEEALLQIDLRIVESRERRTDAGRGPRTGEPF